MEPILLWATRSADSNAPSELTSLSNLVDTDGLETVADLGYLFSTHEEAQQSGVGNLWRIARSLCGDFAPLLRAVTHPPQKKVQTKPPNPTPR
eukprot:1005150-Amphidinium_carterae.1